MCRVCVFVTVCSLLALFDPVAVGSWLSLGDNNLSGQLPSEVSSLSALRVLDIGSSGLSGTWRLTYCSSLAMLQSVYESAQLDLEACLLLLPLLLLLLLLRLCRDASTASRANCTDSFMDEQLHVELNFPNGCPSADPPEVRSESVC